MFIRMIACAALVATISGCATTGSTDTATTPAITAGTPYSLTAADTSAVKDGVRGSLKDPTSPLFGPMVASVDAKGVVTVCGIVNAKNSFGGYVGDSPYIGVITGDKAKKGFVVIGMGGPETDTTVVNSLCQQAGAAV